MSLLPYEVIETLAVLGLGVTGLAVGLVIYMIYLWFKDQIIFHYKRYKDKHFAQKCPKPRCNCIQCGNWYTSEPSRERGLCAAWDKWTAANESCTRSYLRTKDGYEHEECRIKE